MTHRLRALRGVLVVSLLAAVPLPFAAAPAQAVAPAGETTLVSPAEGETVGGNPTLSWTAVAGAARYRVQVSKSSGFETLLYTSDTVNLHATPPDSLPVDTLYWRVAPTDGTTTGIGAYTVGSFTRQWAEAPNLTSPTQDATLTYPDDPLLFKWDALPGAQKYVIQIDDDVNFVGAVNRETSSTSYTLREPQANRQQFFWRVQGVSGAAVSPWSDTRVYQVEWPSRPVLLSPVPSVEPISDVVLRWTPVAGAASYQVQISPNPDFTNNLTVDQLVKGTTFARPATLLNGSYFWRVRALDTKGTAANANLGEWSSQILAAGGELRPAEFVRGWNLRPELESPADQHYTLDVPTFRWKPVPRASYYELRVGSDSNFSPGTFDTCYTNQTSFTPYTSKTSEPSVPGTCAVSPQTNDVLYWTVRGIDAFTTGSPVLGQFADTRAFSFKHTAMPGALSPANGATVATPTLTWSAVPGIAKYKVTVRSGSTNVAGTPVTTYATTFTPSGLTAGKTYSWFVQTIDNEGRAGMFPFAPDQPSFVYEPVTTGEWLDILAPAAGEPTPIMPAMTWTPVTGATRYRVWYSVAGNNAYAELGNTTATSFTSTAIPPTAATYSWYVAAENATGVVIAASGLSTFQLTSIPAASGVAPLNCTPEAACVATGETPALEWTATPYTSGYIVHIANDAGFSSEVRQYVTQFPTLTPRSALLDSSATSAYYWYVRPCRDAKLGLGCAPPPALGLATSAFRKRSLPVQLNSPAHGAVVPGSAAAAPADITFTWAEYSATNSAAVPPSTQGARRYRIQVSASPNFETYLEDREVDQTTFSPFDRAYPEGPLYWRVYAIDNAGNPLTYSETRLVIKETPPLKPLHPQPNATVARTPYFQWTAQEHAGRYEVEVYKNGDVNHSPANLEKMSWTTTSNTVSGGTSTETTAFTPTVALKTGTYAWRVRRMDDNTVPLPGPWADGGVFTVSTAVPALATPPSGTKVNSDALVFTWSPVPGAVRYKFEAANNSGFASPIETVSTVMKSWAAVKRYPDGTVYWRVSALNGDNQVTAVSDTWTIVRDGTAPIVKTKTPTTAAPISGTPFTVTFSEQVSGVSPSTFTMKTTASGAPVAGTTTPAAGTPTTTASFTPSAPLVPGETYTLSLGTGIKDVNGNPLVPFSWTVRTALVVDSASPAVRQFWDRDTSTSASGGGYLASRTAGTRLSYTFTGTTTSILGRKGTDGGYAEVWLDGVKQGTVSFYASSTKWQQTVWSKTGLADKAHRVELRVLGTKPSAASAAWVYPDAFRYGVTTLQETSAAVVQAHRTVALTGALGGSYLLATHTASGDTGTQPYVTLRFKGTGVSWKGVKLPSGGIAKVYVDNVAKATVDTYASSASTAGTVLWNIGGLSNAPHTLKIVVTGGKSASSSGYNVAFDSFSVV